MQEKQIVVILCREKSIILQKEKEVLKYRPNTPKIIPPMSLDSLVSDRWSANMTWTVQATTFNHKSGDFYIFFPVGWTCSWRPTKLLDSVNETFGYGVRSVIHTTSHKNNQSWVTIDSSMNDKPPSKELVIAINVPSCVWAWCEVSSSINSLMFASHQTDQFASDFF
jgi:hypothetical protein